MIHFLFLSVEFRISAEGSHHCYFDSQLTMENQALANQILHLNYTLQDACYTPYQKSFYHPLHHEALEVKLSASISMHIKL